MTRTRLQHLMCAETRSKKPMRWRLPRVCPPPSAPFHRLLAVRLVTTPSRWPSASAAHSAEEVLSIMCPPTTSTLPDLFGRFVKRLKTVTRSDSVSVFLYTDDFHKNKSPILYVRKNSLLTSRFCLTSFWCRTSGHLPAQQSLFWR